MSSKGWINDELAKVMIASREGWAISRREFKPGRKNSIQGMKTKSCIVDWKTSYDNIEFTVQNKHRNYFIHPMLEYHSEHLLNDKIRHDLQHLTYGEGIRKFLADRYGTPGHPIVVQEIRFIPKTNIDSVIFHPEDGYRDPAYGNHSPKWPNGSFREIPYIYDATHYVKNIILSNRATKTGVVYEVIYDDIRFQQHGCREGHSLHTIDRHWTRGIGGQQGNIEEFTAMVEETVNERKRNSRILIFERDDHLILDAWTSDVDFDDKWKAFVQYARELVRPESPHMIVDGVLSKNGRRSEYTSYGPPMAHFCCYMLTPVE
jgi:hypothetical protein